MARLQSDLTVLCEAALAGNIDAARKLRASSTSLSPYPDLISIAEV